MMGTEFVDKVREYLLSVGEDAQGVCVIERYVMCFLLDALLFWLYDFECRLYD